MKFLQLCVDCKFYQETKAGYLTVCRCMHESAASVSPVDGSIVQDECFMRRCASLDRKVCGPEAKYWEPANGR